jgi:hypothetical protein
MPNPSIVQSKTYYSVATGDGSPALTFDAPTTAGNLIVVLTEIGYTFGTVGSIVDSASQAYTQAKAYTDGNSVELEAWYFANSASITTVTVNFAGGFYPDTAVTILEIAGAATSSPFDAAVSASTTSAGALTIGTLTPAQADEILLIWTTATAGSAPTTSTISPSGSFAQISQGFANNGTNNISAVMSAQQTVSSISPVSCAVTWTPNTTYAAGIALSFKAAPPPPPSGFQITTFARGGNSASNSGVSTNAFDAVAGNLIVVAFSAFTPNVLPVAPTDTAGNVYTLIGSSPTTPATGDGVCNIWYWYCNPVLGNAANVVSVAYAGGAANTVGYCQVVAWQISNAKAGAAAINTFQIGAGASGETQTTAPLTTTTANTIVLAYGSLAYTGSTYSAGPDYSIDMSNSDDGGLSGCEHIAYSSTQTGVVPTIVSNNASVAWQMMAVAIAGTSAPIGGRYVQGVNQLTDNTGGSASPTQQFAAATEAGSLLVAIFQVYQGAPLIDITDSQGNTWVVAFSGVISASPYVSYVAYALNTVGGTADVVSFNFTSATVIFTAALAEYSGVNALRSSAFAPGSSSGVVSGPSVATVAGDLVIGTIQAENGGALATFTPGTPPPFTQRNYYGETTSRIYGVIEDATATGVTTASQWSNLGADGFELGTLAFVPSTPPTPPSSGGNKKPTVFTTNVFGAEIDSPSTSIFGTGRRTGIYR